MPCLALTFSLSDEEKPPILPLVHPSSPPNRSPGRISARRVSYTLKTRLEKHHTPILFTLLFVSILGSIFFLTRSSIPSIQFTHSTPRHLYVRDSSEHVHAHVTHTPITETEEDNGLSLLIQDTEELIAEDDEFWDHYVEPIPLSDEEAAAEAEVKARHADVLEHDRQQSLRALIWWLAEGGMFSEDWKVPSKGELRKAGGRGMENMLMGIDNGEAGDEIFEDGWAEFANKRYRIVMFSKSYCPYCKHAKTILDNYFLTPAPFVIELDQRVDHNIIQDLLQHLTGRRSVPNLILDFVSAGGDDDMTLAHSEGAMQKRFEEMKVVPMHGRRRKAPIKL
ncbi:hypothetical protein M231_05840 [Tremella mesenterica]|uniref:Glutaredoxin domain-containing protein n=1 Tax=Tremella mesenterica TaxID=5217 RepID=A0A4Q1BGZ7_TREME|nr:uncharacterized protein TREMEDRAFT_35214 [Tremella mesenterica DSM 1558]EIW66320.1 hypothetical protein TREMEDRAFT_35214 [Tremella mesenterica DSM 1558]RXK36866.1 hypothetical protein M231_05840 [Tremella mesenterica]